MPSGIKYRCLYCTAIHRESKVPVGEWGSICVQCIFAPRGRGCTWLAGPGGCEPFYGSLRTRSHTVHGPLIWIRFILNIDIKLWNFSGLIVLEKIFALYRVRSRNCDCLVTWFCYELIAKPGNKTEAVPWPDPISYLDIEWALVLVFFTEDNSRYWISSKKSEGLAPFIFFLMLITSVT